MKKNSASELTRLPTGVWRCGKRFAASTRHQGKHLWLGCFDSPEEAGRAYRDFCEAHPEKGRKRAQCLPLEERFWASVCKSEGCWEWTGVCYRNGYGQIGNRRKNILAHRLSYELSVGSIPDGLMVLHRCDNRKCVRPDHLFLGTAKDNQQDMAQKGRCVWQKLKRCDYPLIAKAFAVGFATKDIALAYGCSKERVRQIVRSGGVA